MTVRCRRFDFGLHCFIGRLDTAGGADPVNPGEPFRLGQSARYVETLRHVAEQYRRITPRDFRSMTGLMQQVYGVFDEAELAFSALLRLWQRCAERLVDVQTSIPKAIKARIVGTRKGSSKSLRQKFGLL